MFKLPKLFSKEKSILTEEDQRELAELERESFMKEARILMVERGKKKAQMKLIIKEKKKEEF